MKGGRRPGRIALAGLCALSLAGASAGLAYGFVSLRFLSATGPPATWPPVRLPLATVIHSSGSADVAGDGDILAVRAAQQAWNAQNTSYFSFASATVSSSAMVNDGDGRNSILWDETGAVFPPGDTTLAMTILRVDLSSGSILDADSVFNGLAHEWSVATPTPAGRFDIQAAATHEMGHMMGLDHSGVLSATLYPDLPSASQEARALGADDGRGMTALYPESVLQADFRAPSAGEGDASLGMGRIAGRVITVGGAPVHGAQVVALDAAGNLAVGSLTMTDGSYLLPGLPAGAYQVAVSSLDGPVREADLGSGRADNFLAGFPSLFSGGNDSPAWMTVTPGAEVSCPELTVDRPDLPEAEPDGTPGQANPLAEGSPRIGKIASASDADYYSFPVASGEILLLDVDSGGDGNPLDPILTLFDPGGSLPLVSVDDTAGKGLDPRIARRFASPGTYFARVTHAFAEGDAGYAYTLSLSRCAAETEPNGSPGTAQTLPAGGRRGGVLDGGGDVDYYAFQGRPGERLHAEITAARSGSPLDAKLALLAPDALAIVASAADTFGKDPSLDATLPDSPQAETYFLKVEAQSGAGTGAWYCLSLDSAPLQAEMWARNPLGAGVGGALPDSYPRSAAPGESFDLVVAGYGLAPETTAVMPGEGVTLLPTAGPSFAVDASGRGRKAFSVFVSPSAVPGARSLRLQDGGGRETMLPGFLAVRPVAPPGEVGDGSPFQVRWSGDELIWSPAPGASAYHVYRGDFSSLADLDSNGLSDSYGAPLACGVPEPIAADPAVPPLAGGYFYLVEARNGYGSGGLGYASNGLPRPPSSLSPSCP